MDLFYPRALSHLIQYGCMEYTWAYSILGPLVTSYNMAAWNTVDLFYPRALSHLIQYACMEYTWTYSIPGPLVTSYNNGCMEYTWTYSIPGPLVTSYNMPAWNTRGPILSPGPYSPHTICLHGIHVDLFYPRALSHLIQYACTEYTWTYSIPGPLVTSYNMPARNTRGPILSPGP